MINVLIVEDHQMVRMGLEIVLEKSENIEILAQAKNGKEAIELANKLHPDVILMDIGLPQIDGIEATQIIKSQNLSSKVLIFTSRDDQNDVFDALKAGADGYIMKGASSEQIICAIETVNDGAAWLDRSVARLVLANIQKENNVIQEPRRVQKPYISRISSFNKINNGIASSNKENMQVKYQKNPFGLTDRELEVLSLIVEGLSNPEIAQKLVITKATAKAHVHSILQKLYVQDRTQAAVCAMREGLV